MNLTFTTELENFDFPLIIPVFEDDKLDKRFPKHAPLLQAAAFGGKAGEVINYLHNGHVVYLVGLGKKPDKEITISLQKMGGKLANFVRALKSEKVAISCAALDSFDDKNLSVTAQTAYGFGLGAYCFDIYKTDKKPLCPQEVVFFSSSEEKDNQAFKPLFALMDGIYEARDLINEPANMLSPADFVEAVQSMKMKNVSLTVLDKTQMEKLGMNLLVNVAAGAKNEPYLLVAEYMNGKKNEKPIVLVGKGVCFDSGGMNLKPSQGLNHMHYDMAGGGAVIGALWALSNMGAKKNVVCIVPLVENMLSSSAQHTDDVWKSMSGKTVEIGNTDAEGRLILADALWYAEENYQPKMLIDIATLTGVMRYVFADQYAGLFSNDDKLADALQKASDETQDKIWRLPLNAAYGEMLKSSVADICNIGGNGAAGSATAAMFIQNFIKDGTPWAHLDIASVGWNEKDKLCAPKGASGFGVALLTQLVLEA